MSLEVKGKIEKFLEVESGVSKATGNNWKKQSFIVKTDEQFNNLYCFEVFGEEKVDNLTKFNKVGDSVNVQFNVSCNEWKGRYFTSLSAWRVEKSDVAEKEPTESVSIEETDNNDLPF